MMELNEAIRNIVREEILDILDGLKTGLLVRMARATVREATSMLDDEPEPPPPPESSPRQAAAPAKVPSRPKAKKFDPVEVLRDMSECYSAQELALLLGAHVSSMHGWLSGRTKPSAEYAKVIRATVDLAPEQIRERIRQAGENKK